jgi:isoamylase
MAYQLVHTTRKKVTSGSYYQLGATVDADGVNFALYSQNAADVFLLFFDSARSDPSDIIQITHKTRNIWHCHVHGIKPGQRYGYKVRGEYNPAHGMRFNEHKLLLDPYAKAIDGKVFNEDNLLLAYNPQSATRDTSIDTRDSTCCMPKALVVSDAFNWQDDSRPAIPFEKLIIYEVHVKGFTAHPSSGVSDPGTYLGFTKKIPYLKSLGINAVELLPTHEFYIDDFLLNRGLTNYWGYNTIGFFAPEQLYSTRRTPGCQVDEFKTMVRELHRAGIEVLLDVVYNHTGEGNELGPTVSLKGIDNTTYYTLTGTAREPYRYYINQTGCGNTLNLMNPHVIRFVMDSLRYWVEVMHVDGFRFDLASVLGCEEGNFQRCASFFDTISQDPVLQRVKLIAEPWDLSTYQVGNFPIDWSEWNGKFRDNLRKFVKGDEGQLQELGLRLTGSADLYGDDGRSAYNSINFITCHDGFTLHDLVSYNGKHNGTNKEDNNDGTNDNNSWNWGFEGETNDRNIIHLRKQMIKNHACALLFSNGTPMLLGGDEFMRTQRGNNNAYCQDNEISWFDWHLAETNSDMVDFVRKAIAFTKRYPILQKRKFFLGKDTNGNTIADLTWFGAGGQGTQPDWGNPSAKTLCLQIDGSEVEAGKDYRLFIIYNADWKSQTIRLPECISNQKWRRVVDTSLPAGADFVEAGREELLLPDDRYVTNARSTIVLVTK